MQDRTAKDRRNRLTVVVNCRKFSGSSRLRQFAQLRTALGQDTGKRDRTEKQYVTRPGQNWILGVNLCIKGSFVFRLSKTGMQWQWQRGEQVKTSAKPEISFCNVNCLLILGIIDALFGRGWRLLSCFYLHDCMLDCGLCLLLFFGRLNNCVYK